MCFVYSWVYSLLWLPWSCCSFCKTKGSLYTTRPFTSTPTRAIWSGKETAWLSLWLFHYSVVRPTWWWCRAAYLIQCSLISYCMHLIPVSPSTGRTSQNFGKPYAVHMVLKHQHPPCLIFIFFDFVLPLRLEMFYSCKFFHRVWAVCNGPSKGNSKPRGRRENVGLEQCGPWKHCCVRLSAWHKVWSRSQQGKMLMD